MITSLQPILTRQRRKRRSASVFRWLVVGLLLTALPLGLLAWADDAWVLTKGWRWCALALWLVGVLWMLAGAFRAFRAPGTRDVAALLDRQAGRRGGYAISTAVELAPASTRQPEEAALLARLHAEAGSLAAAATLVHPNPRRWQVAAACLAVALVASANPLALRRLFQPSRDLPYTTLSLTGPVADLEERQPFTVSGVIRGKVPPTATLQLTGGTEVVLPVAADGGYRYVFDHGVGAPVRLLVRAGADGISPPLTVAPRDPLHPVAYEHHLQPPAYTRRPEQIETLAAFSILRGSTGRYGVTFNRDTRGAWMVFDTDQPPLNLVPDGSRPLTWKTKLPRLLRTAGYHLEAIAPDGNRRAVGEPGQIVVLPDKPPTVELGSHNEARLKSPHDTFELDYQASDDIGLDEVRLRYQRVGDREWQAAVVPLPSAGTLAYKGSVKLPLEALRLQPHDLVAFVVQARDNNTLDGPGIGSSEPVLIEIPDDPSADGGGGGGGGSGDQVNPLAIERQIYRDTLRSSFGRKAPPLAELVRRQNDNVRNLSDMAAAHQDDAPQEYLDLLEAARGAAAEAAEQLPSDAAGGDYQGTLEQQGTAINSLVKAARMEQPGKGKPGQGKQFSLKTPKASPDKPEERDALEQALADLQKLEQQQRDINQELGEESPEGSGQPGDAAPDGKGQEGQAQNGPSPDGQSPGPSAGADGQAPGSSGGSSGSLAARQGQARERAWQIARQIQSLGRGENGADPAQAVEQMKLAQTQQALAAAALARGTGGALPSGQAAAAALKKAEQLTTSLLGRQPGTAIEPQLTAPGYQNLIQEYTRRLSYDQ